MAVAKLWKGSDLLPARASPATDQAPYAVIMEAQVNGVSTRSVWR